jgi:hypothetical protein
MFSTVLKNIRINFFAIICVKGHLKRKKKKNPYHLQIKFESALYPTALIHIQIRLSPRIRNRIQKYFKV